MSDTKDLSTNLSSGTLEALVIHGDIKSLTPQAKVEYYLNLCRSLDLNPATQPFQVITFQGKQQLYARKDATDQLRARRGISITKIDAREMGGIYIVTAYGTDAKGRQDASTGAVSIKGVSGDALANAIMKAETKAKRRLALSLAGLGMLDESEIETIPGPKEYSTIDVTATETVTEQTTAEEEPKADAKDLAAEYWEKLSNTHALTEKQRLAALAKIKDHKGDVSYLTTALARLDAAEKKWQAEVDAVPDEPQPAGPDVGDGFEDDPLPEPKGEPEQKEIF